MGYATLSDPLLIFALYSGAAVFLLTLVLVLVISVLRYTTDRRRQREKTLTARWQPTFVHAAIGHAFATPRIADRDREVIMLLWIHYVESLRGEARDELRRFALAIGLDITARKFLKRRNLRLRLMAIAALGRMQCADAGEELKVLASDPSPMLSLLAVRSLIQIEPADGVDLLLARLVSRDDYPLFKIAAMLQEVSGDILAPSLLNALIAAPPHAKPRLLALLNVTTMGDTWQVLEPLLQPDQPVEVLAAALKACRDPRALPAARLLATHEQWVVRAQAALTLGRFGEVEDRLRLQAMMTDPQWWVRYRAAKALAGLPGVTRPQLLALREKMTDRFAADILSHVLAEAAAENAA